MAYGNCKDLPGRAISNKILHDKSFIIAENLKYENINTSLPQCFKRVVIIASTKELAKLIHKPIIKKLEK